MELDLLRKFDAKTNRVKGLAFHPHRPWILASLHNGIIQLYDYRMEILLESFEEHEGPVRGIDFHKTQPLFVSGGDDYKVKVWNYQNRRCLYTLHGHLDYIRTVYFHPNQYPWILSASDDQTVRIWNWQSRTCLLVLTGHNHYVMCAQWHPTEDLILSASLDQTIRVWDISGLRKRHTSVVDDMTSPSGSGFGGSNAYGASGSGLGGSGGNASGDVFGNVDAVVKFVLEGHSRGVNWASFHPTMSLVVSGADDREIKVWRMSGSRAWETTTYRGHLNNVSCVLFHAKENIIVSNSEDKTLRVWDVSRNHPPLAFRRDNDRYWILAAHPRLNLLAAGHDNGMFIFKLSRERPAFYYMPSDSIYYFNEGYIRLYTISNQNDKALMPSRGGGGGGSSNNDGYGGSSSMNASSSSSKRSKRPRFLLFNPYNRSSKEVNILMFYDTINSQNGHSSADHECEYELYVMDKKGNNKSSNSRSNGKSVAFVTRNRFAVLNGDSGEIILKNMENISKKKIKIDRNINYIFEGGINRLILRSSEFMTLFDCQSRKIIHELQIPTRFAIKFVDWDKPNYQRCALLAKFSVMICDSSLNDICTIYENAKVKSGAWANNGQVYIYTTVTHMKYALPSGDAGIIKTLDEVLYIAAIIGSKVICMTRDGKMRQIEIDDTEYVFKRALTNKKYSEVRRLIENDQLRGESILAYLQKKGYPEVALRFVQDPSTRFELAIECGNINDAFDCCRQMNNKAIWNRFAAAALMQGNYRYVTEAYKQTLNFEKLMNLFLINGNFFMLNKLSEIAKSKEDKMMIFNIAMYNNGRKDNDECILQRIECLKEAQQYGLAYLTALSNQKNEIANDIKTKYLADKEIQIPKHLMQCALFSNPKVFYGPFEASDDGKYDWPQCPKEIDLFDQADAVQSGDNESSQQRMSAIKKNYNIDDDDDDDLDNVDSDDQNVSNSDDDQRDNANVNVPDIDSSDFVSSDEDDDKNGGGALDGGKNASSLFMMPANGKNVRERWLSRSICAPDMIAAGSFELAQENLHRNFGIVNFEPLKTYFLQIFSSCHGQVSIVPNSSDISFGIRRNENDKKEYMASICVSLSSCRQILKDAHLSVTNGKFEQAMTLFRKILHIAPLLIISNSDELRDVRSLIKSAREYVNALRVKMAADKCKESEKERKFELECYFTHFELMDAHIFSGLYTAMKNGYKCAYYATTAVLCRRLLELAVSGRVKNDATQKYISQVKKVLNKCEKKSAEANENEQNLKYKPHDFTDLCCGSLEPILRNEETVKSPYCGSIFKAKYNGQLSPVCNLVRIGGNNQGVTINTK